MNSPDYGVISPVSRQLPVVWGNVADVLRRSVTRLKEALVATALFGPPADAPIAIPLNA